jgi:hypothetical protein
MAQETVAELIMCRFCLKLRVCFNTFIAVHSNNKGKAVPLHAMEALGGEDV